LYINLFYAIQDVHVCWNRVITESVTVLKSVTALVIFAGIRGSRFTVRQPPPEQRFL
jgi:hypothetical protein